MAVDVLDVRVLLLQMLGAFLFFLIATFIVIMLIRGLGQLGGKAPRQTIPATVAAKRREGGGHFVTFQSESGESAEIAVSGAEYGLLKEGDAGELTVQGGRYVGFVRD